MYTVRQVLRPEFTRSWQESVAIVQEAAALLQPGLALPDPEDLILNESGTLSFGFGSETSQHPVAGLASLLEELLQGTDPPESLVSMASASAQLTSDHSSLDAFSRALAFYERPNRANDLRAVVGRLRGTPSEESVADLEFERLRERVAGKPASDEFSNEPVKEAKPKTHLRVPKLTRRQQQVVAAGIIAGVLVGLFAAKGSPLPRLAGVYDRVEASLSGALSAGLDKAGGVGNAVPAPTTGAVAPAKPEPLEKAAPKAAPRSSGNAASTARRAASDVKAPEAHAPSTSAPSIPEREPSSERNTTVPSPGLASRSLSPPTVRTEPVALSPSPAPAPGAGIPNVVPAPLVAPPDQVYSPATPGVSPPVLMRPQMPREPAPGDDTGYFEIVVDEKGSAEQVKLISPRRRYHDRMLVAAAKAWQFRPATLDGRPVKYRVLVPIILSGLPY